MSYTALYRKWRPDTFLDVKGQDPIVQTLRNQIMTQRAGHAYLFCGTRGTGKTSIAKIFAKAVNCEQPEEGNPCNQCKICRSIASGASLNVVEIDAASNNGVENIREIREQVQYPPTEGRYRVYIIDEVHMLSTGAFNALLKTLEEPPEYVIFILATTEANKIPVTVLSRCQRYDFKRITLEGLTGRLRELSQAESIQVEDKALTYIAKAADGSMRDALSLLDQCVAFHFGELLTYEHVLEILGAVDTAVFSRLFCAIEEGRTADCIYALEEMTVQGRELGQFVTDFIWYLRNLLLLKTAGDTGDLVDISEENQKQLQKEAQGCDSETIMRYIRVLSELSGQLRYSSQKRVLIELALIKLTRPAMEQNLDSVLHRLAQIEKQLQDGIGGRLTDTVLETGNNEGKEDSVSKMPSTTALPKAKLEDLNQIRRDWSKIVGQFQGGERSCLKEVTVEPGEGNCIWLVFPKSHMMKMGFKDAVKERLTQYAAHEYGKEIEFQARTLQEGEVLNTIYVTEEELHETIHMEIVTEP